MTFDRKGYLKKYRDNWRKLGICVQCGCESRPGRQLCEGCKDKNRKHTRNWFRTPEGRAYRTEWVREKAWRVKIAVLSHYGGKCACCGESDPRFLTIDHKNGDGSTDKRNRCSTGRKTGTVEWYARIIKLGFPEDLQPLCWNCNQGKHMYGNNQICPHKMKPGERMRAFRNKVNRP